MSGPAKASKRYKPLLWALLVACILILAWRSIYNPLAPKDVPSHGYYWSRAESGSEFLELDLSEPERRHIWWQSFGADGAWIFSLEIRDGAWAGNDTWNSDRGELEKAFLPHGSISSDGKTLRAIVLTKGTNIFQRIAQTRCVELVRGFRFANRGARLTMRAEYPHFISNHPFAQHLNSFLAEKARRQLSANGWLDESLGLGGQLKSMFDGPSYTGEWSSKSSYHIISLNGRGCSLLEQLDSYTGGAHGMTGFTVWNFLWDGKTLKKVEIDEFFRANSPWQQQLTDLTVKKLQKLQASWVVTNGSKVLAPDFWQRYTFAPDGLRFHFDPYEAGSYSEGSFTVLVRWDELESLLNQETLSRLLPTTPNSRPK